ncbi:MAG TPA: class I SAM-dependent methyltransferase [Kofleriaceae bacterium]|nr:class I SAM-dependent methyltransferase [Kofleriaceae bacterium]
MSAISPSADVPVFAGYDLWASSYDELDNPLVAMAAYALTGRLGRFAGARVLELGCGTGRNAPVLLAAGAASYVGVDGSAGMLAQARTRTADPRASFIEADMVASLPAEHAGFDAVLFCLVLEHAPAVEPAIAAATAALRPGGEMLIYELHPDHHDAGRRAHFVVGDQELRLPSYRHDAAEFHRAATAAGLEVTTEASWYASSESARLSAKLDRYRGGHPILIELRALRRHG